MSVQAIIVATSNWRHKSVKRGLLESEPSSYGFFCKPNEAITSVFNGLADVVFILKGSKRGIATSPVKEMIRGGTVDLTPTENKATYQIPMELKTSMMNAAHHVTVLETSDKYNKANRLAKLVTTIPRIISKDCLTFATEFGTEVLNIHGDL